MSKTLAAEIAGRTLEVVNPQNRDMALASALKRHGFTLSAEPTVGALADRTALIAWLLAEFAADR